jgi:hypothetical protein
MQTTRAFAWRCRLGMANGEARPRATGRDEASALAMRCMNVREGRCG